MATQNFVCHNHDFKCLYSLKEVSQNESSIDVQSKTSSSSLPLVNIHCSLQTGDLLWIKPYSDNLAEVHEELILFRSDWRKEKLTNNILTPKVILSDDRFYHEISNLVGKIPNVEFQDNLHSIVQKTMRQLRRIIGKNSNKGRRMLEVSLDLRLVKNHVCDERILFGLSHGMVPASKSSLTLLKKMQVDEENTNDDDECAVCLDELVKDQTHEILRMPCSHIFHGECITKWLETSHYCPICRFEMPMENQS